MEVWKTIPRWPSLEASSLGRLRRKRTGYILKTKPRRCDGYVQVHVQDNTWFYVHRLIADAFHGLPAGMEVDHRNGIRSDNRASNLESVTLQENRRRAQKRRKVLRRVSTADKSSVKKSMDIVS